MIAGQLHSSCVDVENVGIVQEVPVLWIEYEPGEKTMAASWDSSFANQTAFHEGRLIIGDLFDDGFNDFRRNDGPGGHGVGDSERIASHRPS